MAEFSSVGFVPDPSLPAAFVEGPADTGLDLPHVMWNPEWRPALDAFARVVPTLDPYLTLNYHEPFPEHTPEGADPTDPLLPWVGRPVTSTMHVEPSQVVDVSLRAELLQLAKALYQYEIPGEHEGVVVTRSMIGEPRDYVYKHLFGLLRAGLVDLTGQRLAAHVVETHDTGNDEHFPPHIDLWVTGLLLNIFNVHPPGQGVATLVPMAKAWDVIANSGIPDEGLVAMQRMLDDRGECDLFNKFNSWIYDDQPWTDSLTDELFAISDYCDMGAGQGYLVNDRNWLHGRTNLKWTPEYTHADKLNRLYRLGYNNHRLQRLAEERQTRWDEIGYYSSDCVGQAVHYETVEHEPAAS